MKQGREGKMRFATFFAILSITVISPAMSANLIATPGISIEESWDSNIFSTSDNTTSDFITRAVPALSLSLETLETSVVLNGSLEYNRYSSHSELNGRRTTTAGLSTGKPLQISPRLSLQPTVQFVETLDPYRRNQLLASPIPGLPPSEVILTVPTKARDFSGSLQMKYLLAPDVDLGLGAGGTKRTFLDNDTGTIDSNTVTGNASIAYHFTPRFSSGIAVNTSYNRYENDTDSRSYGAGITGSYILSEHFMFDAIAGVDYLRESTSTGKKSTTSPSGQASLTYDWKDFRAVLLGSYGLTGGGSFGVTTHRGNIQLSLAYQFAQGWWWDLGSSYQVNRSLDTPRTEDINAWSGHAGLRYQAAKWAFFRLAGNISQQRARNSVKGADLDQSSVVLGLELKQDYKLF
jgi:hypothetical protein